MLLMNMMPRRHEKYQTDENCSDYFRGVAATALLVNNF